EGFSGYDSYIESLCGSYKDIDEVPLHLYHPGLLTSKVGSLPMVGSPAGGGMFRFTRENGVCRVNASLSFRRKVARIDVVNLVKEGFAVEGVALCNWRDAVAVDEDIEFVGSVHNEISGFSQFPDADETGIQKLMGELYCFPSCSELSKTNDSNSTALILKARYGEDVDPSYYRINVGFDGSRAEVKPNTRYSVTVTSVRGRGASSPEEAFSSEDDNLVLSMVEDWDLEGCYDMDDNGNFMVLSRASIEFAGNSTDFVEIKILTSKGLEWSSEYRPDGEEAADAFIVSKISDGSFVVSPARENSSQDTLGGKCHVSAVTPQGNILSVDISLRQLPGGETPYEPVIPWEKDFALVRLEGGERVKVDLDEMTIEVDGFDPGCFNSFIDIPFMIY
ncbi:MAG: hypothetical protein K2O47_07325, partial [Muribaculaceae bacterium]|nr:hypothetical protein [Muribaculaceae bacterium]